MSEQILLSLPRPGGAELRVTRDVYRGAERIDLRHWFATADGMRPTQKGVSLELDEVAAVVAALASVSATPEK